MASVNTWALAQSRDAAERLATARLDPETLGRELIAVTQRVIPFSGWCFAVADPETLLVSTAVAQNPVLTAVTKLVRYFELEYGDDVNRYRDLVGRRSPVGTLSSATDGDLRQSARWRELYEASGMGDELRAALVVDGRCWGYLELLRERDERPFSAEEAMFLLRFAPQVATSVRGALVADLSRTQVREHGAHRGPGTVILDQEFRPIASTPEADQWMALLRSTSDGNGIPVAVLQVAVRLRSLGRLRPLPGEEPRVRARAPTGDWITISASHLTGSALSGSTAVTLEGSGSGVADLALEAYGLTARERELAKLVLQGFSNLEIAKRLVLSPHTVGDHIKAILEKVGAHSKRELIAGLLRGATRQTADVGGSDRAGGLLPGGTRFRFTAD